MRGMPFSFLSLKWRLQHVFRAILHDENVFTDPGEYRPERYLKEGRLDTAVRQPEVCAFGVGRRYQPISTYFQVDAEH